MNYSKWDEEEVKTLFRFVEVKKSEGVALVNIFKDYANKTHRAKNSVRNYYYKEIIELSNNNERLKKLKIDLSLHNVKVALPFSKKEEDKMMKEMKFLINKGYSVRKACLELSKGDISTMIRIQNKYRSLKAKNLNKDKKVNCDNIIKMPIKKEILSEQDINALFLGLVRLVKKQEYENAKNIMQKEINTANQKLKEAITIIANKENEIKSLKCEIAIYKSKEVFKKETELNNKLKQEKNNKAKNALELYFNKSKNNNKVKAN